MPHYMTQVSYNSEAWKAQMHNPEDRSAQIGKLIEAVGGRLISFYYAFGEYDVVIISEAPDSKAVASVLIAAAAGGALSGIKTTALMTIEEGMEAIKGARAVAYAPPG